MTPPHRPAGRRPAKPKEGQLTRKIPALAALLLCLVAAPPTTAQARCLSSDIVVVDRSLFVPTIERARVVIRGQGRDSTPVPYAEGSDLDAFVERVAAFHPRLVVVHYSMFRPGHPARGKVTAQFLAALQKQATPPEHVILYSSSLYDAVLNPGGRTLAQLREEGFFAGIPDARVSLIHVNNGPRFTAKNGAASLGAVIASLEMVGACSG